MNYKVISRNRHGSTTAYILGLTRKGPDSRKPYVISGNPIVFDAVISERYHRDTHTSAILSWEEELDPGTVRAHVDQFLDILLAGIPRAQVAHVAVVHREKAGGGAFRTAVHVLIANTHLPTGKKLSLFFAPKDHFRLAAWAHLINYTYGYSDPLDPDRQRGTNTSRRGLPRATKLYILELERYVLAAHKAEEIPDLRHASLIRALRRRDEIVTVSAGKSRGGRPCLKVLTYHNRNREGRNIPVILNGALWENGARLKDRVLQTATFERTPETRNHLTLLMCSAMMRKRHEFAPLVVAAHRSRRLPPVTEVITGRIKEAREHIVDLLSTRTTSSRVRIKQVLCELREEREVNNPTKVCITGSVEAAHSTPKNLENGTNDHMELVEINVRRLESVFSNQQPYPEIY